MALFKNTVDSILSDVQKKIDQLQALAEGEKVRASIERGRAAQAIQIANEAEVEAERALRISAKIEELVA